MNGFKGIEKLPFHSEKEVYDSSTTSTAAEDNETNKSEVTSDHANADTETKTGPELPPPVPNLF